MSTVTREEARRRFDELLNRLPSEGEIVITDGDKPVAKLTATPGGAAPKKSGHSIFDIKPVSLGGLLKPYPHPDDDILGEMLEGKLENWRPK